MEIPEIPKIKLYVLPGGVRPVKGNPFAAGYDVALRAIVSAHRVIKSADGSQPDLRETIFDFQERPKDPEVNRHVMEVGGKLVYRLEPGECVLGGIGFATELPSGWYSWLAPRSGLASKHLITLKNSPGTIDEDYRGEAGAIISNENIEPGKHYDLTQNMWIAQMLFAKWPEHEIEEVDVFSKLSKTGRGSGGFGSTGIHAHERKQ